MGWLGLLKGALRSSGRELRAGRSQEKPLSFRVCVGKRKQEEEVRKVWGHRSCLHCYWLFAGRPCLISE